MLKFKKIGISLFAFLIAFNPILAYADDGDVDLPAVLPTAYKEAQLKINKGDSEKAVAPETPEPVSGEKKEGDKKETPSVPTTTTSSDLPTDGSEASTILSNNMVKVIKTGNFGNVGLFFGPVSGSSTLSSYSVIQNTANLSLSGIDVLDKQLEGNGDMATAYYQFGSAVSYLKSVGRNRDASQMSAEKIVNQFNGVALSVSRFGFIIFDNYNPGPVILSFYNSEYLYDNRFSNNRLLLMAKELTLVNETIHFFGDEYMAGLPFSFYLAAVLIIFGIAWGVLQRAFNGKHASIAVRKAISRLVMIPLGLFAISYMLTNLFPLVTNAVLDSNKAESNSIVSHNLNLADWYAQANFGLPADVELKVSNGKFVLTPEIVSKINHYSADKLAQGQLYIAQSSFSNEAEKKGIINAAIGSAAKAATARGGILDSINDGYNGFMDGVGNVGNGIASGFGWNIKFDTERGKRKEAERKKVDEALAKANKTNNSGNAKNPSVSLNDEKGDTNVVKNAKAEARQQVTDDGIAARIISMSTVGENNVRVSFAQQYVRDGMYGAVGQNGEKWNTEMIYKMAKSIRDGKEVKFEDSDLVNSPYLTSGTMTYTSDPSKGTFSYRVPGSGYGFSPLVAYNLMMTDFTGTGINVTSNIKQNSYPPVIIGASSGVSISEAGNVDAPSLVRFWASLVMLTAVFKVMSDVFVSGIGASIKGAPGAALGSAEGTGRAIGGLIALFLGLFGISFIMTLTLELVDMIWQLMGMIFESITADEDSDLFAPMLEDINDIPWFGGLLAGVIKGVTSLIFFVVMIMLLGNIVRAPILAFGAWVTGIPDRLSDAFKRKVSMFTGDHFSGGRAGGYGSGGSSGSGSGASSAAKAEMNKGLEKAKDRGRAIGTGAKMVAAGAAGALGAKLLGGSSIHDSDSEAIDNSNSSVFSSTGDQLSDTESNQEVDSEEIVNAMDPGAEQLEKEEFIEKGETKEGETKENPGETKESTKSSNNLVKTGESSSEIKSADPNSVNNPSGKPGDPNGVNNPNDKPGEGSKESVVNNEHSASHNDKNNHTQDNQHSDKDHTSSEHSEQTTPVGSESQLSKSELTEILGNDGDAYQSFNTNGGDDSTINAAMFDSEGNYIGGNHIDSENITDNVNDKLTVNGDSITAEGGYSQTIDNNYTPSEKDIPTGQSSGQGLSPANEVPSGTPNNVTPVVNPNSGNSGITSEGVGSGTQQGNQQLKPFSSLEPSKNNSQQSNGQGNGSNHVAALKSKIGQFGQKGKHAVGAALVAGSGRAGSESIKAGLLHMAAGTVGLHKYSEKKVAQAHQDKGYKTEISQAMRQSQRGENVQVSEGAHDYISRRRQSVEKKRNKMIKKRERLNNKPTVNAKRAERLERKINTFSNKIGAIDKTANALQPKNPNAKKPK